MTCDVGTVDAMQHGRPRASAPGYIEHEAVASPRSPLLIRAIILPKLNHVIRNKSLVLFLLRPLSLFPTFLAPLSLRLKFLLMLMLGFGPAAIKTERFLVLLPFGQLADEIFRLLAKKAFSGEGLQAQEVYFFWICSCFLTDQELTGTRMLPDPGTLRWGERHIRHLLSRV